MVDNQHQKITGYRDLTQAEIDLMNEIKTQESVIASLHARVVNMHATMHATMETAEARRQLAIARTEIESAFMHMVRAVAKPASPWVTT